MKNDSTIALVAAALSTVRHAEARYPSFKAAAELAADVRATHYPMAWTVYGERGPRNWPVGILSVTPVGTAELAVAWMLAPTAYELAQAKRRSQHTADVARIATETERTNARLGGARR